MTKNYTINGIQKAEEFGNKGFNEIRNFYVRKRIVFIKYRKPLRVQLSLRSKK